jgi:glyoxylase-like metal-dependent hydrolase (beta-lactamase superfamily II)
VASSPADTDSQRLYFRQLLSGRDFASDDPMAAQMVNFVYLIGDRASGEAVVIDPAYRPGEILDIAAADGMRVVGALATHYHPDHIGGSMMGFTIDGIAELLERQGMKVHVQRDEAEFVKKTAGVSDADLAVHDAGDVLTVGDLAIELIHTPGHTPGSQCFLVRGNLVAGDTLFLEGCGRTDLPGSDASLMYESLLTLGRLPDDTVLFPGHKYSLHSSATLAITKETNFVYKPSSKEQWLTMFGL